MDNKHYSAEIFKVEQNVQAASKFVLVEDTHVLGKIAIISLGNSLFLRTLSGSNLCVRDIPLTISEGGGSPPVEPPAYCSFSAQGSGAILEEYQPSCLWHTFKTQKLKTNFESCFENKKKKVKTGFLGH